ncbi:MAG TPA: EthD family reductase [Candidatus Limnocylindrales bacterium]
MSTLLAFYRRPAGDDDAVAAFEKQYAETHLPLIARLPGLRALRVARVRRVIAGQSDAALVARMNFDDWDAAKAALNSDEMRAAGDNLAAIGGDDLLTLLVVDEARDLIPEEAP